MTPINEPDALPPPVPGERLESVLLTAALDESSGVIKLSLDSEWGPLYLRKGLLYLSKAKALALIQTVTAEEASALDSLPGVTEPNKRRILFALAKSLPNGDRLATFAAGNPPAAAAPFIGPLPAEALLQECRVHGVSDIELVASLGGEGVWLQTRVDAPGLSWLSTLGSDAARWVSRFAEADSLLSVLRAAKNRHTAVQEISRLHALGILQAVLDPRRKADVDRQSGDGRAIVPRDTLEGFIERIRDSVVDVPLGVDTEQHRAEVAELIAASGGADHYELLGIDVDIKSEEIIGPYRQLARLVHPDHAPTLGLAGGEAALAVLFERATQAYLVLSDPERRKAYDLEMDLSGSRVSERTEEEIVESRRKIAKKSYQEARRQLHQEDYHYAFEYCQIAVQNDPKPEYLALLGEIQSHNPKWLGDAAGSLLKALEMEPTDTVFRYKLAAVYEKMGNEPAARAAYEAVLAEMSNHPGALEALERLDTAGQPQRGGILGSVRRWFSSD